MGSLFFLEREIRDLEYLEGFVGIFLHLFGIGLLNRFFDQVFFVPVFFLGGRGLNLGINLRSFSLVLSLSRIKRKNFLFSRIMF